MEMYGTSGYSRLDGVYRVGAVDPVGMYVHPDKQEEEKQRKRKAFRHSAKKETDKDEHTGYVEVQYQEAQSFRKSRTDTADIPLSPFMLWVYMAAKNGQTVIEKEDNPGSGRQMEKYIAAQEKAAMNFSGYEREAASFNAKA